MLWPRTPIQISPKTKTQRALAEESAVWARRVWFAPFCERSAGQPWQADAVKIIEQILEVRAEDTIGGAASKLPDRRPDGADFCAAREGLSHQQRQRSIARCHSAAPCLLHQGRAAAAIFVSTGRVRPKLSASLERDGVKLPHLLAAHATDHAHREIRQPSRLERLQQFLHPTCAIHVVAANLMNH